MKKIKTAGIVAVLILLAVLIGTAQAGDWPMMGHDPCHTRYLDSNIPNDLNLNWMADLPIRGGEVMQPIVNDGNIFVYYCSFMMASSQPIQYEMLEEDNFFCLDEASGEILWSFKVEKPPWSPWEVYSPCAADGKIYIPCETYLYCLDAKSGELLWKFTDQSMRSGTRSTSPVAIGDRVYFMVSCEVYCINRANGELIWKYTTRGGSRFPPAIDDNKLFVANQVVSIIF